MPVSHRCVSLHPIHTASPITKRVPDMLSQLKAACPHQCVLMARRPELPDNMGLGLSEEVKSGPNSNWGWY